MLSPVTPDDFIHIADTKIVQLFLRFGGSEANEQADVEAYEHEKQSECDVEHLFSSNWNQGSLGTRVIAGVLPWSSNQVVTSYLVELWDLIEKLWKAKTSSRPPFCHVFPSNTVACFE